MLQAMSKERRYRCVAITLEGVGRCAAIILRGGEGVGRCVAITFRTWGVPAHD